jgi:hypothetical protein
MLGNYGVFTDLILGKTNLCGTSRGSMQPDCGEYLYFPEVSGILDLATQREPKAVGLAKNRSQQAPSLRRSA